MGVSFDNAYSSCPSCIPARVALFTGKSQEGHGRVGYEDGIDWNYEHMMAEEFSSNGYQTECIGKMHVHPQESTAAFKVSNSTMDISGIIAVKTFPHHQHQEVTDDYLYYLKDKLGQHADITSTGPECNSWIVHPWIYDGKNCIPPTGQQTKAFRFLQTRDRTRPIFLMTSFVRPHQPFDPPQT